MKLRIVRTYNIGYGGPEMFEVQSYDMTTQSWEMVKDEYREPARFRFIVDAKQFIENGCARKRFTVEYEVETEPQKPPTIYYMCSDGNDQYPPAVEELT